jgi:hypothetical protein
MIYVGDANDPATILADSKVFYSTWCASSPDDQVADWIKGNPDGNPPDAPLGPDWGLGAHAAALVQMYDLMAPLDRAQAARYLERLRQIAGALLANRDDNRLIPPVDPVEPFRGRVMPAWGGLAADRDNQWNTDPVIAGLFIYPMAAFARRVADNPALHAQYEADAIRFVTATMETYEAFRQAGELHLDDSDPEAYYVVPSGYADLLQCTDQAFQVRCEGWREAAAGKKPISHNENLSMMKALAEVALAADSTLYRDSPDVTPERLRLATEEVPLLIAKNVAFFVNHLRPNTLPDGTPYFDEWFTQPWSTPHVPSEIEDTSHGGLETGCLAVILDDQIRLNALLARAGRNERVPLSPSLFERFANTFLRIIWHNDNTLNAKVDGTGDQGGKWNSECAGWIPLAQFDPWVWTRSRDTNYFNTSYLREDNHAALLRYRQFNSIKYLTDFAGQNWLITPAALAVGERPPASIHDQKWLLVLSGVVIADLKGDNSGDWNRETVSFMPDMAGPDDPSSTSGPLTWAINHFSIPKPPGSPGRDYLIRFSLEQPEWAPFVCLSSIFNENQSINSGFAVDVWRPNHFGSGTDVLTNHPVNNLFAGINADLAVRDTDAWIYRLSYNITLLGKIVFVAVRRTKSRAKS